MNYSFYFGCILSLLILSIVSWMFEQILLKLESLPFNSGIPPKTSRSSKLQLDVERVVSERSSAQA